MNDIPEWAMKRAEAAMRPTEKVHAYRYTDAYEDIARALVEARAEGITEGGSCSLAALSIARDEALEEAAKVCEDSDDHYFDTVEGARFAYAIRAMKSSGQDD